MSIVVRKISWREAACLSPVVLQLESNTDCWTISTRVAYSGSNDMVYRLSSKTTNCKIEYTTKLRSDGSRFVNWCAISGTPKEIQKFFKLIKHVDYVG